MASLKGALRALAIALAAAPALAHAQGDQEIDSLALRVTGADRASIEAKVSASLGDRLVEMIRNERPLRFTLEVEVVVERPWWPDLEYETIGWDALIGYDNVLDAYQVITFNGEELVRRDIGEALAAIGDVRGLEIIGDGLGERLKLSRALIRARFQVDADRLPPPVRIDLLSRLDWGFSSGWRVWRSRELIRGPQ